MPGVRFTSWFQGPAAIYNFSTAEGDPVTLLPYLGTDFQVNYFTDLSQQDAELWNQQYALTYPLNGGRYRIVKIASDAVAADITPNNPVGWATGPMVGSLGFTPGSGYTNNVYNISSSASTGQVAAVAQVTVAGGAITGVALISGGNGFLTTAPPTFSLTALGSGGSGGAVTAQLEVTGGFVTSLSSVDEGGTTGPVRGIALCNPGPTSAQITAGAWIIIQELGIAPVLIGTVNANTNTQVIAVTGGTTATQASAYSALEIGKVLTPPTAGQIAPVALSLPTYPF